MLIKPGLNLGMLHIVVLESAQPVSSWHLDGLGIGIGRVTFSLSPGDRRGGPLLGLGWLRGQLEYLGGWSGFRMLNFRVSSSVFFGKVDNRSRDDGVSHIVIDEKWFVIAMEGLLNTLFGISTSLHTYHLFGIWYKQLFFSLSLKNYRIWDKFLARRWW
jgi:hypothetical protein